MRAPVTTAAAIATVAVAVGGAVAAFALVESVLLRDLPFKEPDRLVAVWVDYTKIAETVGIQDPKREWTNLANHRDIRSRSETLEDLAVFTGYNATVLDPEGSWTVPAAAPSWNGLRVLGVQPVLGRDFLEEEGAPGAEACAVIIGHSLWQTRYAGDAGVIGRAVSTPGETCTIVGVMPAGFRFPWVPDAQWFSPIRNSGDDRGAAFLRQYGRLASGATLEQARAELDAIAGALQSEYPQANRDLEHFVEPLQNALVLGVEDRLVMLQFAALLVLVVALANLASLVVARMQSRSGEFAVRACLGASRWARFRLIWVECMVVGGIGAGAGLLLASLGLEQLVTVLPANFTNAWEVQIGPLALTAGLVAGLVAGTLVALIAHFSLVSTNTISGGGIVGRVAGSRGGRRLSAGLVASNFALAFAVTVLGVLLFQSYQNLRDTDLGFAPEGVLSGSIILRSERFSPHYPDSAALTAAYARLLESLEGVPGVEQVGLASSVPLGQGNSDTFVSLEGYQNPRTEDGRVHAWFARVTENYLPTMGIRIQSGRGFDSSDRLEGRDTVVVNAAFAREYLSGTEAVGKRIGLGDPAQPRWFEIIGVVDDVRFFDVSQPQTPALYLNAWAAPGRSMTIVLDAVVPPASLIPAVTRVIRDFDADIALTNVRTMDDRVADALMVPRAVSGLTVLFALCALALAGIGVYGTLAQSVIQRTREFGVRRALGAQAGDVVRMVLRQGIVPVVVGVVIGVPLAWFATQRSEGVLYGVAAGEPFTWLVAVLLIGSVAVAAAVLPGRRAARVPPMEALREE